MSRCHTKYKPTATVTSISTAATALNIVLILLLSASAVFAQGTVAPSPKFTGFDNSGLIVAGGKLCTYNSGTTTPAPTYSDVGLTVPNSNPVILDSAGRATVFLPAAAFKFILKTPGSDSTCNTGTTLWTQDSVSAVPSSSANVDVPGTAGEALSAGQAVYLSDGSGSKSAGQWYRADSSNTYSSTLNTVGMVPTAISSGAIGTVRLYGSVTGLSSLTTGTVYYVSTTGTLTATPPANARKLGQADSSTSLVLKEIPPTAPALVPIIQGRLSLTSGSPVTTADVTAATTVYWTCGGSTACQVALYDGANWNIRTFTELSIAVPATTNVVYDVTLQDNGTSTPSLVLLQWTNDTTRSIALATQNGVLEPAGNLTKRYAGTFRTTGVSGQTEDSCAKRYVWNYYNRVQRSLCLQETTGSWTYTSAAWRQARATATNQVDAVFGVAETLLTLTASSTSSNSAGSACLTSIGQDSTSTPMSGIGGWMQAGGAGVPNTTTFMVTLYPAVGRHFFTWLEYAQANTCTFYGSNVLSNMGGLLGWIQG